MLRILSRSRDWVHHDPLRRAASLARKESKAARLSTQRRTLMERVSGRQVLLLVAIPSVAWLSSVPGLFVRQHLSLMLFIPTPQDEDLSTSKTLRRNSV